MAAAEVDMRGVEEEGVATMVEVEEEEEEVEEEVDTTTGVVEVEVEVVDITLLATRAIADRRKSRHSLLNAVLNKENHAQIQGSKNGTLAPEVNLWFWNVSVQEDSNYFLIFSFVNQENFLTCVYEMALWNIQ